MKTLTLQQQQARFMEACQQIVEKRWHNHYSADHLAQASMYATLMYEEFMEVIDALDPAQGEDPVESGANMTAELVDLVYVIMGFCNTLGLPFDEMWQEVHGANLRKINEHGWVEFREDGKVLKPEGWKPADKVAAMSRSKELN